MTNWLTSEWTNVQLIFLRWYLPTLNINIINIIYHVPKKPVNIFRKWWDHSHYCLNVSSFLCLIKFTSFVFQSFHIFSLRLYSSGNFFFATLLCSLHKIRCGVTTYTSGSVSNFVVKLSSIHWIGLPASVLLLLFGFLCPSKHLPGYQMSKIYNTFCSTRTDRGRRCRSLRNYSVGRSS